MQRFCLTLELRDDPALIAQYITLHQAVWPQVEQSIRDSGILTMELYLLGTRLAMLLQTTDEFTFEHKAALDRANPKVLEWEQLMSAFQKVSPTSDPTSRWQAMQLIYQLGDLTS